MKNEDDQARSGQSGRSTADQRGPDRAELREEQYHRVIAAVNKWAQARIDKESCSFTNLLELEVHKELDALMKAAGALLAPFPHLCQDEHPPVRWSGDGEMCPVCVAKSALASGSS